jgi:hypothetical protein
VCHKLHMATETQIKHRSFRPWPAAQFALTQAERAGFNVSELLNEIVTKHLPAHIERKAQAQLRASRAIKPTPAKLTKSRH